MPYLGGIPFRSLVCLGKFTVLTTVEQTFKLLTIVLSNYECWPWC